MTSILKIPASIPTSLQKDSNPTQLHLISAIASVFLVCACSQAAPAPESTKVAVAPNSNTTASTNNTVPANNNATSVTAGDDLSKLRNSQDQWAKLKQANNGNYTLESQMSNMMGARTTTAVVVKKNKVVSRSYQAFGAPMPVKPGQQEKPASSWTERGKNLASHKEGLLPAATLDQLYDTCGKLITDKLEGYMRRTVTYDQQGILSACYVRDTRIMDDAPLNGVRPFKLK